jgi:hypothetical protein
MVGRRVPGIRAHLRFDELRTRFFHSREIPADFVGEVQADEVVVEDDGTME